MTPDPAAVPDGWQVVRLGDVLKLEYGVSLPERDRLPGPIPVFGSAGVVGVHDRATNTGPGVIVGRKGSIGAVTWVAGDFIPIDTTYYSVPVGTRADLRWIYHLLTRENLAGLNRATGVPGLNRDDVYALRRPLPPLAEQRAIAAVLDAIDEAIERSEEVIAATERLRDALLHELLTRGLPGRHSEWADVTGLGTVPACWGVVRLGDVAKFRSGFGARSSELQPRSDAYPFPVYGGNGVAGYWPEPLVEHRVVVIGRVGQKCGAVLVTDGPAWITDNALYNEELAEGVTTDFLALVAARARLNDIRNRNDLPLVTQQIVHSVPVALPSLTEQRTIVAVLDGVDAAIKEAREGRERLHSLQASAADALLTGRVRVGTGRTLEID